MKKTFCISTVLLLFGSILTACPSSVTPTITSFAINNDDASMVDLAVTLNNVCTGNPTYYMASESSSFLGATWQIYSTSPAFTFSSSKSFKTVYFKVKNEGKESISVCDTISSSLYTATEETILLPGNVPMIMVWCPAGTFMMGRMSGEQDSLPYEAPQHQVTLSQGFWIGKYELTKAQWMAIMGTTPWYTTGTGLNEPDSPAVYLSWDDAQSFITAINSYTGKTFKLPSEAQWEYACRAGTTTRFYWGDDLNYTEIGNYAWWNGNTWAVNEKYAHLVGQKLPNDFGLYDMSGNISEWCQDWYNLYTVDATIDPTGPTEPLTGDVSNRVVRGGCGYFLSSACRSSYRGITTQSNKSFDFGFRLAR